MPTLKTFNLVQNSMNKLAVNIEAKGISNAIMKLGQHIVYEEVDEKRKSKKRAKKGFAALSDDNEETKGEDCKQMEGLGSRKRDTSLGMMPNARTLDGRLGLDSGGGNTDRTEKTQSGGSQDFGRRMPNTDVLDDMEEDDEFEALDTRQKSSMKNIKMDGSKQTAKYDVASLGEKDEKFEDLKTSEQAAFRDETIHASSGTLAKTMPSKKRGQAK